MNRCSFPTARANRLRSPRRGFGMAEVLVAATLVAVVVVGALNAVGMALRAQRANAERSIRFALAQEIMAAQLAKPYSELKTLNPGYIDHTDYANWGYLISVDEVDAQSDALPTSPLGLARLKRVKVTVSTPPNHVDTTMLTALRSDNVPPAMPLAIELRVGDRSDGRDDRSQFTAAVLLNAN